MRAVIISAPFEASLDEIERIPVDPGEILIRCRTAAVCTTERRVFSGHLKYYPAIGGHEFAGVVESVDGADTGLAPGDHVAIDAHNRCGTCHYCVRGRSNVCVKMHELRKDYRFVLIGGGFADYAVALPSQVVRLPKHVDLEEASLMEPLACCINSIKKTDLAYGDTIAIAGAGTMGLLHLLLAKLRGASVLVTDVDAARLEMARRLGADHTVNPLEADPVAAVREITDGRGADAVVVAASARAAGEQGLAMVGRSGRLVFYASLHPRESLELDWNRIHYEEITVTGSEGNTERDFREAVALLAGGAIDLRPLISRVIALEELPAELASKPAGETQRVVVRL
jgi:L-iditol 2-dehydrogenase